MRESSCVLYLGEQNPRLFDVQIGTPASVEFDFIKVWEQCKKVHFAPSDLLFIHVHPRGFGVGCSSTDIDCLQGYVKAFGSSPRFGIVSYDRVEVSSMHGRYQEYYCTSNLEVRHRYYPRQKMSAEGLQIILDNNKQLEPYFRMLYYLSHTPGLAIFPQKEIDKG